MAAYAQFGYGGYPSASQLLSTNMAQAAQTGGGGGSGGDTTTGAAQQTPMAAANAPALSPTSAIECRAQQQPNAAAGTGVGAGAGTVDVPAGALSPDTLSQTSSNPNGGGALNSNNASGAAHVEGVVGGGVGASGATCCENGRPIMTDPVSGQTVCSCQYDSARLALSSYSRLPAASVGVYGTPYPSTDQNPYQSIGVDSSAFYSPLSNPYALKDSAAGTEMTAWTSAGLQPTTGYYSYDPMSAYGYGPSYDLAARRKNATRESTATLKAWLNEHKKNPYPTKGEKIMLAIITKMTLTQVSTWFANARRRLKKENKMTWEPKNRTDDDEDALVSDDEKEKDELEGEKSAAVTGNNMHVGADAGMKRKDIDKDDDELHDDEQKPLGSHPNDLRNAGLGFPGTGSYHGASAGGSHPHGYHPYHHPQHPAYYQHQQALLAASGYHAGGTAGSVGLNSSASASNNNNSSNAGNNNNLSKHDANTIDSKNQLSRDCGVPIPATKPKIWSLADTVACKTPPPSAYMGQVQQQQQPLPLQSHMASGNPHMAMQQMQQQQQQQQQQQIQQQQQHPNTAPVPPPPPPTSHMMSSYGGGTAYSRVPPTSAYGGFLGATMQQLHTTTNIHSYSNHNNSNSSNNNGSSNSNSNNTSNHGQPLTTNSSNNNTSNTSNSNNTNSMVTTPAPPLPPPPVLRQTANAHHPYAAAQRAMVGFPEAQPDTPPQTPPNMKLQSVAANLLLTASQAPTIATYRSNGHGHGHSGGHNSYSSGVLNGLYGSMGGSGGANPCAMNYSTRFDEYSPRDDSSSVSSSSCSSSGSPRLQQNESSYKAAFKRQQIAVAGFVSPV